MGTAASAAVFAVTMCLSATATWAQVPDFTQMDINGLNNQLNQQRNQAMAYQQNQLIASILNDPQAMAAYRAGVCGYGLTPQQFAYKWAATRHCTPGGAGDFMRNEQNNNYKEQQAYQNYQRAQQERAWAMQRQQQHFYGNQYQQGMMLGGWKYQYLPNGQIYWYR